MAVTPYHTKAIPSTPRKVTIIVMPNDNTVDPPRNRIIEVESVETLWGQAVSLMMTLTELNLAYHYVDLETGPTLYVTLPYSDNKESAEFSMHHTADLLTQLLK